VTKNSGDFCDVSAPIRPSVDDHLTGGTKRQIVKLDAYGAKVCGWKP
jgi:hypothetical protein